MECIIRSNANSAAKVEKVTNEKATLVDEEAQAGNIWDKNIPKNLEHVNE
ncbi:hypothetical protein OROHE_001176 [Orobanche hederae]